MSQELNIPELLLDPALKVWVLAPITLVMVMVGVLRTYITVLLQPSTKLQDHLLVREQQHLNRLRTFRRNSFVLAHKALFASRVEFFSTEYSGTKYLKEQPSTDPNEVKNPFGDANTSDMMFQMLKNNAAGYIPQTVIMWWVNLFFKGYVVMRLPFNITSNFKSMLQTSINTVDLDASYVSSISWYFVNLLGLKSIYSLILDDGELVNQLMNAQQQQPMIQPQLAGAGPTPERMFKSELESLHLVPFKSCLDSVEDRFVNKWTN